MIKRVRWMLVAGLLFFGAGRAAACSLIPPTLESLADGTPLAVIGTISNAGEDIATIEVEQYLKGGEGAREISLLNHELTLSPSCQPELGAGSRWSDGTRVLAFLGPATFDLGADWQDGGPAGMGIIVINDDMIILPSGDLLPLADAITRITGQPADDAIILPTIPPMEQSALPMPALPMPERGGPISTMPLPRPDGIPVVPEPTVAPEVAALAAAQTRASAIPWVLLGVGIASGIGALLGMLRTRRQED